MKPGLVLFLVEVRTRAPVFVFALVLLAMLVGIVLVAGPSSDVGTAIGSLGAVSSCGLFGGLLGATGGHAIGERWEFALARAVTRQQLFLARISADSSAVVIVALLGATLGFSSGVGYGKALALSLGVAACAYLGAAALSVRGQRPLVALMFGPLLILLPVSLLFALGFSRFTLIPIAMPLLGLGASVFLVGLALLDVHSLFLKAPKPGRRWFGPIAVVFLMSSWLSCDSLPSVGSESSGRRGYGARVFSPPSSTPAPQPVPSDPSGPRP